MTYIHNLYFNLNFKVANITKKVYIANIFETYFSFLCLAINAPRSPPSQNSITM